MNPHRTRTLSRFLDHLKTVFPLHSVRVKAYYHDTPMLPPLPDNTVTYKGESNAKAVVAGVAFMLPRRVTEIHVAKCPTVYQTLTVLAHEYRHAWQREVSRDVTKHPKAEWDAHKFATTYTKKYCRANNIPIH